MRRLAAALAILPAFVALSVSGQQLAGRALLALGFPSAAAEILKEAGWKGTALYAAGRWSEAANLFAGDGANAYNLGNALARGGRIEDAIAAYDRALAADPGDEDAAFNKALLTTALLQKSKAQGNDGIAASSVASRAGRFDDHPGSGNGEGGSGAGLASGQEGASRPGLRASSNVATSGTGEGENADNVHGAGAGAGDTSERASATIGQPDAITGLLRERERRMQRRLEAGSVQPSLEWLNTLPDDPGRFLKLRILAEKARRTQASGGHQQDDD